MDIGDFMTPRPFSIDASEMVSKAIQLMYSHEIRHLPVTRGEELAGIITDRDIKLALAVSRGQYTAESLTVDEICVSDPYVVDIHEPLAKVVAHMAKEKIGSTIVTKEGKLAGIFTVTDACRELGKLLG